MSILLRDLQGMNVSVYCIKIYLHFHNVYLFLQEDLEALATSLQSVTTQDDEGEDGEQKQHTQVRHPSLSLSRSLALSLSLSLSLCVCVCVLQKSNVSKFELVDIYLRWSYIKLVNISEISIFN